MFRLRRSVVGLAGLVGILIFSSSLYGETIYSNNFEEEKSEMGFCIGGGEIGWLGGLETAKRKGFITVNYEGLSEERTLSGKKSYKIDITLNEGGWCQFFHRIKPKSLLKSPTYLSCYIYVEENSGLLVKPGIQWGNSPAGVQGFAYMLGGWSHAAGFTKRPDGWRFFQSPDIHQALKKSWEKKGKEWNPSKAYLEAWYIHIGGNFKGGKRVVIYLDDVTLGNKRVKQLALSQETMVQKKGIFLGERERYEVRKRNLISSSGKNIIPNSSFELGVKNWEVLRLPGRNQKDTEWRLDEDTAYHGRRSLCIEDRTGEYSPTLLQTIPLAISSGKDYILSFYAKGEGMNVGVGKAVYGGGPVAKTVHLSKDWQRYEVPIKGSSSFSLSFTIREKGKLWIDAVQLEETDKATAFSPSPALEVGLITDKKGDIYSLGETPEINFYLFNGKEEVVKGKLTYRIKDFYHNIIKEDSFGFNLSPGKSKRVVKKIKIDKKGIFWVRAILSEEENEDKKDAEINLAVISPLKGKDENSFFGVSALGGIYNSEKEYKIAESIGMKWFNAYSPFYYAYAPQNWKETAKQGKWNIGYTESADRCLELGKRYNLTCAAVPIGGLPSWALKKANIKEYRWHNPPKPEYITEEILAGWSDFIYTCVNRFKDKIKSWAVWGESVHSEENAETMIKFTKSFYEAAKKADPFCVVMGLGLDSFEGGGTVRWSEEFFNLGGLNYLDKVGIHPYAKGISPERVEWGKQLESLKEAMRKYGEEKGIWITEIGWQATNTFYEDIRYCGQMPYSKMLSEEAQADYIIRSNIISKAHGVERYATFLIRGNLISYPFLNGLTYNACSSPKASIPAYNTMAALLNDTSFAEEILLKENIRCYVFKNKEGKYIAAIWNPSEDKRKTKIEIPINQKGTKIIDLMGNEVSPEIKKGKVVICLPGGSPVYLIGEKALLSALSRAKVKVERLIIKPITFLNLPDERIVLPISNQTSKKISVKAELINFPFSWQAREKKREIELSPKEEKDIVFLLDKADFLSERKDYKVEVNLTIGEETVLIKSEPVFSPYLILPPAIDADLKEWNLPFFLDKANFKALDKKLTQGNLFAKVYTGWDKDCFYCAAEVTDSKFNQPYTGKKIWAGDSIQLGFDTLNDAKKSGYDQNDYGYNLALTRNGPKVSSSHRGTEELIKRVRLAIRKEDNKLYYEAAFPWETLLPFEPKEGKNMGFSLTIMDNDEEETTKKWLELTPGITCGKNPSLFKDLVFIGKEN